MQTNDHVPGSFMTSGRVLGPDGQPWQKQFGYDNFDLPHVIQFASVQNTATRVFMHGEADDAIRNDRDADLWLRRDTHIMRLLREREDAVVSLKWHLETDDERNPQHKAVKDGVTACLNLMPRPKAMTRYLSQGVWYGKYAAQLDYEWQQLQVPDPQNTGNRIMKRAPVIKAHSPVNGDKIGFHFDGTPYILVNSAYADRLPHARVVNTSWGRGVKIEGSWRDKFIIHQHGITDSSFWHPEQASSVHGLGIRSVLYWLSWLRKELLSNVLDYCERQGLGLRVWRYQGGNPASKAEVENAAKLQTDKTNVIIPSFPNHLGKSSEGVEFVDTGSQGANILRDIYNDFKAETELFVIGQTLSSGTEGSGLGGSGVAGLHANTKHQIISLDADNLDETYTRDLVRPVLAWMYPEFRDMPLRRVSETNSPNQGEQIDAVCKLFNVGVDFVKSEARALTGLSDPQEGDETISLQTLQKQQIQIQTTITPPPGAGIPGDGDNDGIANEDGEPTEADYAELASMLGA